MYITMIEIGRRMAGAIRPAVVAASGGLVIITSGAAHASVSGPCANCHTMHNSQGASPVVRTGDGTGWSSEGKLAGGASSDTPVGSLLVSDCVGCHSSSSDQTIIDLAGNKIPIVYNTSGYPSKPLAGGNFYQVAQGSEFDGYGHNVYGIASPDSTLDMAPGNTNCSGDNSACHMTLASSSNVYDRPGCRGCHYNVYHHDDNGNYRFLNSHDGGYVEGIEHDSWEHPDTAGPDSHNYYKGVDRTKVTDTVLDNLESASNHSISSFCAGCHSGFHGSNGDGIGDGSPWLRHPTNIALPQDREYAAYDPTSDYSLQAPVAWVDPANPVRSEAIVMCLSCHRVHGSDHPDILRWDYGTMIAGDNETGAAIGEGCFVCHTTKD